MGLPLVHRPHERAQVEWLDEVTVEARFEGTSAIVFLSVASQRVQVRQTRMNCYWLAAAIDVTRAVSASLYS
jgi:hypothetical protein